MIPDQLKKDGIRFILVKKKDKIPFEKDWQNTANYKYDNPKLLKHISIGNYGVVCGYANLVVVDFDNEAIQNRIAHLLPETLTIVSGGGLLHKYFFVDKPESIKILDDRKNTLIDIQGPGKQIIGPGSTHPNGNKYVVIDDKDIAYISMPELKALFGEYIKPKEIKKQTQQSDKTKEQIKTQIKVDDLLSKYNIPTNKNPTTCPFHSSKGGKCLSYTDEVWHCFHCDKGGDIFTLSMEMEDKDFITIKKRFMEQLGIKEESPQGILKITNYIDNVNIFYQHQPIFYDKSKNFWFWNKKEHKWEIVDEIDVMNSIEKELHFGGETVTGGIKNNYLEAFKRVGREHIPKEPPKQWIQFKNKIFDLKTKEIREATPEYFICNPIPWEIGESTETPTIDKLFEEWVGVEDMQTLYEIICYCCVTDYPIHSLFCLIGIGRNGKTCFQKLLAKFIGKDNVVSTELDILINSRFESAKLYKKLVCSLGETNFGTLSKTSLLKKLTGQDLIGYEYKNKTPFDDYNYAKILINSNSLPTTEDTSEGFYRRWLIIDFPNQFPEGKDIIETIPEEEFRNLALRVTKFIPQLIENGKFGNQGSIEERRDKYMMASNPLPYFLDNFCVKHQEVYILYSELYIAYVTFLQKKKRRIVSKKEFGKVLIQEGLDHRRTTHYKDDEAIPGWFVEGIELKENWKEEIK